MITNFIRGEHFCDIYLIIKAATEFFVDLKAELFCRLGAKVKLECSNHMMKYVVERFGKKVKNEIATEDTFYAYPEVVISPNFYSISAAWCLNSVEEIRILSHVKAVNKIKEIAQKVLNAE